MAKCCLDHMDEASDLSGLCTNLGAYLSDADKVVVVDMPI